MTGRDPVLSNVLGHKKNAKAQAYDLRVIGIPQTIEDDLPAYAKLAKESVDKTLPASEG